MLLKNTSKLLCVICVTLGQIACQSSSEENDNGEVVVPDGLERENHDADKFLEIYPTNQNKDTLRLDNFTERVAFVFWLSTNKMAHYDLPKIKETERLLKKHGMEVVYLAWDKSYERWAEKSTAYDLGDNSYILNADQKFQLHQKFVMQEFPRIIIVEAPTATVVHADAPLPYRDDFMKETR